MVAASNEIENTLKVSVKIAIAAVMLTPLIVMASPLPGTFFPFIVGKALYSRTMIEIAFGLWVVLALRSPEYRAPRSLLLPLFAMYVVVALLASLLGVSPQRSLWSTYERMQGFVDLAHWLAFVWVLAAVFRSWSDWRWLLSFTLGLSVFMGLLGLSQHYQFSVVVDQFSYLKATTRVDITLGNPTYVGAYMLVHVLIAMAFLSRSYVRTPQPTVSRSADRRRSRSRRRRRSASAEGISAQTVWLGLWLAAVTLGALTLANNGAWEALAALAINLAAVTFVVRERATPIEWRWSALAAMLFVFLFAFYRNGSVDQMALVVWLVALRLAYVKDNSRETTWRVFWITAIALDALILYLSGTRGAFVGLVGGLVAFAIGYTIWGRLRPLRIVSVVTIAVLVSLALGVVLVRDTAAFESVAATNPMLQRLGSAGLGDDSLVGRIDSASIGIEGFINRPILGWGPENFTIAYDRYVTTDIVATAATSFDQAHNKLIEELTTKGILGFLAYMSLWVYMASIVARKVAHQDDQTQLFILFGAAALAGYFVQNLFLFDTPGTGPLFYLLLGFMVYVDTSTRTAEDDEPAAQATEERPGGLGRRRLLQSQNALIDALVGASVLVALTIFVVNYRAFDASTTLLEMLDGSSTWDERLEKFDRTVDTFPQLANYPRIVMFNQLNRSWRDLTPEEATAALTASTQEGLAGIKTEPEEWRIYLSLASIYHQAAATHPGSVESAKQLVDHAATLAPARIEVVQMQVQQSVLENDHAAALAVIDAYLEKSPEAARYLQGMRDQVVAASGE